MRICISWIHLNLVLIKPENEFINIPFLFLFQLKILKRVKVVTGTSQWLKTKKYSFKKVKATKIKKVKAASFPSKLKSIFIKRNVELNSTHERRFAHQARFFHWLYFLRTRQKEKKSRPIVVEALFVAF